jgi:hypothetical protein
MVFHTPVGVFKTKVKDDPDHIVNDKMTDFPSRYGTGVTVTTDSGSAIFLNYEVLSKSVLEIVQV